MSCVAQVFFDTPQKSAAETTLSRHNNNKIYFLSSIIIAAARSAIIIVGAFVLPLGISGMTEQSTTRKFLIP